MPILDYDRDYQTLIEQSPCQELKMLKAISFHVLAGDESGVSDELVYGRQKIRQSWGSSERADEVKIT